MTEPRIHFQDDTVTLWHGDSLATLREFESGSVDCCVTSPPYFGLRDYGEDGQYGLEASPAEYVETMRAVFAEVRRVLADDGTLWLNLGDSYSVRGTSIRGRSALGLADTERTRGSMSPPMAEKNLMGMPWRTAFALQDDGWILRNDIIWAKPNGMPESVTDRLSTKHEHLFMLGKSTRYWFNLDPIREVALYPADSPALNWSRDTKEADVPGQSMRQHRRERPKNKSPRHVAATDNTGWKDHEPKAHPGGRNPGDVWTMATQPFSEAHFAVMPSALAERAIQAGCKPGGVVLDPFSGSGTTGLAAAKHGRKYVGIDLSADYLDLSLRTRLGQTALLDGGAA